MDKERGPRVDRAGSSQGVSPAQGPGKHLASGSHSDCQAESPPPSLSGEWSVPPVQAGHGDHVAVLPPWVLRQVLPR